MRRWMWMVLCVLPFNAFAAARFVSTTGFDIGDCTGAPCATISYAIGQAVAGDIIDVGPGTFSNGGANVNIDKTLIVQGAQAPFDARGRVGAETILTVPVLLNADDILFDGFTVTCGACTGIGAGIVTSSSFTGHQLINNIVTGNPIGIYPSGNTTIRFNHVTGNNFGLGVLAAAGTGIYTDNGAQNVVIDQNWLDGHETTNINIIGTPTQQANAQITNNRFAQDTVDDANAVVLFDNTSTIVSRNEITGGTASSIFVGGGNLFIEISENLITGSTSSAISVLDAGFGDNGEVDIDRNTIMNNLRGVSVGAGNPIPVALAANRIEDNGTDVRTTAAVAVDAENNWWGCNEGPAVCAVFEVFPGSAIDADPWLIMDISAVPDSITTLQTSNVTSDFLQNSDGAPIGGSFDFWPTFVAFSATGGTMAPPSDPMSGGAASSTFTPTSAGVATVNATLDDETVSTTIDVAAIAVTMSLTSDNNPSQFGENVTFTATLSDPAATGTVTFTDGMTHLGTVPVAGGVAQLTTNTLSLGSHTITATYSGDATFTPATAVLTQVVGPADFAAVPALSEWMLVLMALAMGIAAFVALRR